MSDNHEDGGIVEDKLPEMSQDGGNGLAGLSDSVDLTGLHTDAGETSAESAEEHQEHRVPRSVSNKPLIDDEQVRKHAENAAPAVQMKRSARRRTTPRARRMNLSVTHLNPWSVAKVTFMMSVAGAIIQIVAAALVWVLLDIVGVFDQITQIVASTGLDAGGLNLADVFSLPTILSGTTIFSIVEVVLFTLLATVVALLYNVVSVLVGGIHVTLGDD